ncbi:MULTISPECIES: DUF5819 family protein [Streptomyces]|uniref:DUF5819 family protein n=1 Tax=Streptomyces TaxID=1883 RepID=UPI0028B1FB7F|nr:DUF5819 family protein [Streptomyces parvus]
MTQHLMVRRAALIIGAALLGIYFLFSSFSQMPLTPMKVKYYSQVNDVMQPYLAQNWMLFAPDPLSDERGILSRARCADGTATDFYDVTGPYVQKVQSDRFFPSRINRLVSGTVAQLDSSDPVLQRLRDTEKEAKKKQLPLLPYEKTSREQAERFLSRYSLTQMPGVCAGRPAAVQVRVYVHELPPWSQRKDESAKGSTKYQDLSWREVDTLK